MKTLKELEGVARDAEHRWHRAFEKMTRLRKAIEDHQGEFDQAKGGCRTATRAYHQAYFKAHPNARG